MRSLVQELGYDASANFVEAGDISAYGAQPFSHLCRKLGERLQGVYLIGGDKTQSAVPVVAVCRAADEAEAREIHALIWNQDFVPFVLVESAASVRLYSGFQYQSGAEEVPGSGFIEALTDFNKIGEILDGFQSEKIDNGELWQKWGSYVDPDRRVDWHLLHNLELLGQKLRDQGLDKTLAHALIGRFVYLRYLLDRGFLSPRKLTKWELTSDQVFSHRATLTAFRSLNEHLDDETDGLNGAIFPFNHSHIKQQHLRTVAAAFKGDDVQSGQAVFDFEAYNFSYIPIETLSVVYEQFLHAPTDGKRISEG